MAADVEGPQIQSITAVDTISESLVRRMRRTLGLPDSAASELPPLWHWALFQEWAPPQALGMDGHAKPHGFLPHDAALPCRMWAGGRLRFHDVLCVNDTVTRTSKIESIREKTGSRGRLLFVTIRHEMRGPRGIAIEEEQDLVYKSRVGAALARGEATDAASAATLRRSVTPDPVLLFRFSALTGNSHRIHYDKDYAVDVEGYPGLVVHGPLQALLLAGLVTESGLGRLGKFEFRAVRPAFVNQPLVLEGRVLDRQIELCTRDEHHHLLMRAEALLQ